MKLSKLLIPVALILSLNVVHAQDTEADKEESSSDEGSKDLGPIFNGASISVSFGTNFYYGDLAAYDVFPRPNQFKDYLTPAFKASIARDIKWGLGAKFNFQVGTLQGIRKTGVNSSTVNFKNEFFDLSFQLRYLLNDVLFKKSEYNRLKLYAHAGVGSTWYRAQLFDTRTLETRDFEGFIEIEGTQGQSLKRLSDETSKARTSTIPFGITLSYKLNYKADIHFDFTQTATKTDRLDAFGRSFSSRDKYNYLGLGFTFNFNRTEEDSPKRRPKKEKKKKDAYDNGSSSDNNDNDSSNASSNSSDDIRKGIFSRNRNKQGRGNRGNRGNRGRGNDDELLNIRLKLFETQLKLFEMQYLLGK